MKGFVVQDKITKVLQPKVIRAEYLCNDIKKNPAKK